MALLDLWANSPEQLQSKQIQQLIAFAGAGRLLDDTVCSSEFRAFLASVPSANLSAYSEQCLGQAFQDSGLALQDIVNEIGSRLGAATSAGRYRGTPKHTGFDGLWLFPSGHSIVVEVKTTDAYRIDLNTIAAYREALVGSQKVTESNSSILLVVGRQDTGDLEAQIRGSRHAWDVRIISVVALLRLMKIKEAVEDPAIVERIHNILIPREFTRLDAIAEVLFSAAEDIKQEDKPEETSEDEPKASTNSKLGPVSFHEPCISRIQEALSVTLVKRSRAGYSTPDKSLAINCSASKEYDSDTQPNYWFAFHPHQQQFLKGYPASYVAFGCGSSKRVLLIPFDKFEPLLEMAWTTVKEDRMYWHIVIFWSEGKYTMRRRKGEKPIDLTSYALPEPD